MSVGNIIDFTTLDKEIQELIREGAAARQMSYSPYSNFKVGAAIRCDDGTISKGCNVENASYPNGICAERTAICKAVSEGKRKFKALVVVADQVNTAFTSPCGICRQTVIEFGDIPIYLTKPDMKTVLQTSAKDMLPLAFVMNV